MPGDPLARRAVTTPDRTALVEPDGETWTYAALDRLTGRVADELDETLPADPPTRRLGVALSPRLGFVATLHAALRLGWTVVLLDPRATARELDARVAGTEPAALVCEATSAAACEATELPVVSLDETETARLLDPGQADRTAHRRAEQPTAREPGLPGAMDDKTRLVLFTSGTTGEPKAVRLTGMNLFASAVASAFRLGVTPDDRWLGCLPVHHMGGLAPVFRSAWYGTTLVLQGGFDAAETTQLLHEEAITGVSLVPTQLRRLLDAGLSPPDSLRTVLLGGAPADEELVERALDAGVPVHPTYGLTEAASQVTTARPSALRTDPATVGQPLCLTDVRLVAGGRPVDPGERGEIVIAGPTVTPGYLDEDATAEAFGEWGLHTGDLGVRDEAGRLRVVGRLDDVVNTGGELVAPAEVVDVLETHPEVSAAAVVGLDDPEWGEQVAALVVPTADASLSTEAIRAFCHDRLARYKIPKTVATADGLPRTTSGTVDRGAVAAVLQDDAAET